MIIMKKRFLSTPTIQHKVSLLEVWKDLFRKRTIHFRCNLAKGTPEHIKLKFFIILLNCHLQAHSKTLNEQVSWKREKAMSVGRLT